MFLLPVHVFEAVLSSTWLPAKQHHNTVSLSRDEPKNKYIPHPAAVALQHCLTEGTILVKSYLLMFCSD